MLTVGVLYTAFIMLKPKIQADRGKLVGTPQRQAPDMSPVTQENTHQLKPETL